jgi:hypothetical protein
MNMNKYPSAREIGEEALAALRAAREDPKTLFWRLVERGWINANGEVTWLLGGDAQPEPTAKIELPTFNGQGADDSEARK